MVTHPYSTAYYTEDHKESDEKDGDAEINMAKQRNGTTGSIPLTFIKELMSFETRAFEKDPN